MGELQHNWFLMRPEPTAGYPAGFWRWIDTIEGMTTWLDFETKALKMARKRKRYSAKAIIEVIRWETSLKDGTEFKINNNWSPGLARLWMHNYGREYPNFFQLRDGLGHDSIS